MDTLDPPNDGDAQQAEAGLASSRSRRERNPRAAKTGRFSALEKLKVIFTYLFIRKLIIYY